MKCQALESDNPTVK